jgi:hypothetical protein
VLVGIPRCYLPRWEEGGGGVLRCQGKHHTMDAAAAAASSLGHVAGATNTPDATPAAGSAPHDTTGGARTPASSQRPLAGLLRSGPVRMPAGAVRPRTAPRTWRPSRKTRRLPAPRGGFALTPTCKVQGKKLKWKLQSCHSKLLNLWALWGQCWHYVFESQLLGRKGCMLHGAASVVGCLY